MVVLPVPQQLNRFENGDTGMAQVVTKSHAASEVKLTMLELDTHEHIYEDT